MSGHARSETAAPRRIETSLRAASRPGAVTRPRVTAAVSVALFFVHALVLLVCYYLLKTLREPLLLTEGSPEVKSIAQAAVASVLLVLVPAYAAAAKRLDRRKLVRGITVFFAANLLLFCVLGRAGADIAVAYYVWVGVFGVVIVAQFWAHAADAFDVQNGERVFPVIAGGAVLGGFIGPLLFRVLYPPLGVWPLMLICAGLLAATLPLMEWSRRAVPESCRSSDPVAAPTAPAGFSLVLNDRYLRQLVLLVVLLNCVNTTGEYLLSKHVVAYADRVVGLDPDLDRGDVIGAFYASFYFAVNTLAVATQLLLVGRIFRWVGIAGAVLVAPLFAVVGYALAAFVPVFAIVKLVKTVENGVNYSLTNTVRHSLYLPLAPGAKYEGKTAIDAFFWRFGDVLQAGIVYAGANAFGFGVREFACVNLGLALLWLLVAVRLSRSYAERKQPSANHSLGDPRSAAAASNAPAMFKRPCP